jgi:hypothetical protein
MGAGWTRRAATPSGMRSATRPVEGGPGTFGFRRAATDAARGRETERYPPAQRAPSLGTGPRRDGRGRPPAGRCRPETSGHDGPPLPQLPSWDRGGSDVPGRHGRLADAGCSGRRRCDRQTCASRAGGWSGPTRPGHGATSSSSRRGDPPGSPACPGPLPVPRSLQHALLECGGLTPLWISTAKHPKRRPAAALHKPSSHRPEKVWTPGSPRVMRERGEEGGHPAPLPPALTCPGNATHAAVVWCRYPPL